ncbi:MAG: prepilin peptidase [Cetobacterium sp.]
MEAHYIFNMGVILLLLIISYIDIKKMELPDLLTFLLVLVGVVYHAFYTGRWVEAVIGMGVYSLPFSLIYGYGSELYNFILKLANRKSKEEIEEIEVLGYGDVKLAMGIGACLGYTSLYETYLFFMLSFVVGAIYSIFLLIKIRTKGEENSNREFPFAPFISISGSILILLGGAL